jgi:phage-related protein
MDYTITYYSESVQEQILDLPDTLAARYVVLTRRMVAIGPNLGEPHTKAFGDGLFELRLKGAEGIARVPKRELDVAHTRLKEIKHANT